MILSYDTVRHLLIEVLDGESGQVISDYAHEYGEPGYNFPYGAETPIFLIGDWWCRCGKNPHAGQLRGWADGSVEKADGLHDVASHHPRLWAQLESQGVECAFYDEWTVIDDKAWRTTADSYFWQSSIQWDDHGEYLTPDDDIETWIEWAVNDPERCLMDRYRHALSEAGYVQWEPDDPHEYQSGWHEGMDDDPKKVYDEISLHALRNDCEPFDVVFVLDETSQFYVGFSAWTRPKEDS